MDVDVSGIAKDGGSLRVGEIRLQVIAAGLADCAPVNSFLEALPKIIVCLAACLN